MSRKNIRRDINAVVKLASHSPNSIILELSQKQGETRRHTITIPISPSQKDSSLEEVIESIKQEKIVRFKGTYEEKPTSVFAYIMVVLNSSLAIGYKSTLEVFKRFSYEGRISVSTETRKRRCYYIELAQDSTFLPEHRFKIEKT